MGIHLLSKRMFSVFTTRGLVCLTRKEPGGRLSTNFEAKSEIKILTQQRSIVFV